MAYHWTIIERKLGFGDGRQVVVGETLSVPDPTKEIKCCEYGMHSSKRVIEALEFAPGCTLFEVSHPSGIAQEQDDKQVGPDRRADYCYGDLTDIVIVFAKWCAARAQRYAAAWAADAEYAIRAASDVAARAAAWAAAWAADAEYAAANARAWAARAAAYAADADAEREVQEQWWQDYLSAYKSCE